MNYPKNNLETPVLKFCNGGIEGSLGDEGKLCNLWKKLFHSFPVGTNELPEHSEEGEESYDEDEVQGDFRPFDAFDVSCETARTREKMLMAKRDIVPMNKSKHG
jgi:hypothetical protein